MTIPSANSWSNNKSQLVSCLADKYGLKYYDYNQEYPKDFNWKEHTKDAGNHLNYNGAYVMTKAFGDVLVNDLNVKASNLTDTQRKHWDKNYVKLQKQVGKAAA